MMHHWLDLSFEEIAAVSYYGETADALRQRYHRAMKKLLERRKQDEIKQKKRLQN